MPELPEMEAWRRALDDPVSAFPAEKAGPAHIATLKAFDPPLSTLEGRRFAGAERRAKRLLFPTEDGELVLMIHLMSAGRVRYLLGGEKGPKSPAFRLRFQGGGELVLTEAGAKKRAGVWLLTPEAVEEELSHLGPEALGVGAEQLREILGSDNRRLHSLLRDQRAIAGIGRAWANEILHSAQLSPYAMSTDLTSQQVEALAGAIDSELERGPELDVFEAAALGRADRLRELVAGDAGLANAYGDDGFQPLALACFYGHIAAAKALLDAGADPNTLGRNQHIQTNALHAAAASENKGEATRYELCKLLLDRGADPGIPQGTNEFRAIDSARLNGDTRLEALLST